MQKKNKANLALGISAAGFLGTMGWGGFVPGLVHHGFLAATIGGMADWFAVTAIFHKPLGISYRTDILRRNRGRIMDAIVTFASDDLLSVDHIMTIVNQQDTGRLMADYLQHRGGRERVQAVVEEVMLRTVSDMDTRAIAKELAPSVREGLAGFALEDIATDALQLLAEEKHSRRILHSLLTIGQQVLNSPAMQQVLLDNIHTLRVAYERDSFTRNFLLGYLDLSDEKILEIFNHRLLTWMEKMLGGETQSYAGVKAGLETILRNLSYDDSLRRMFARGKAYYLNQMDIEGFLVSWMDGNLKGENPFWLEPLHYFVDQQIDHFCTSAVMQRHFDHFLKQFLQDELEKHHVLIPDLIRERLNELSDDQLVDLVEGKVQDDLQMIRINGAVVGSLVGMGLYLVVCVAERMWGL